MNKPPLFRNMGRGWRYMSAASGKTAGKNRSAICSWIVCGRTACTFWALETAVSGASGQEIFETRLAI